MITSLTLGSILLGGALVVVVVLYLARPLMDPDSAAEFTDLEEVEILQARKFALLKKIQELDDDLEASKVAPELYAYDRPRLVKQAAAVMQQLDQLEARHQPTAQPITGDVDAQIEAAVRQRRSPAEVDADIEAAISQRRTGSAAATANGTTTRATRYCPQCGRPVEASDRFCAACGHNLAGEPSPKSVATSG